MKDKSCLRSSRPIIDHRNGSNPPGFRVSHPLPTLKVADRLPLCLGGISTSRAERLDQLRKRPTKRPDWNDLMQVIIPNHKTF